VSSPTRAVSMGAVRRLSTATRLNVAGLVLTAAGMLVQIAAGSTLYPSLAGPIVLIVAAVLVTFGPARSAPWVGLVVPVVLGAGAIVAAVMTGELVDQLTDVTQPGIFIGSLIYVVGLIAAVAGGVGMLQDRRKTSDGER